MPTRRPIDRRKFLSCTAAAAVAGIYPPGVSADPEPLVGTHALVGGGDLPAQMVDGLHKYLDRELASFVRGVRRDSHSGAVMPPDARRSVDESRRRLRQLIGAVDELVCTELDYVYAERKSHLPAALEFATSDPNKPLPIARGRDYSVFAVRWRAFDGVDGDGLLLEPNGVPRARIVALPDADWSPEMLVGLAPGVEPKSQFARRFAENGCQVLVPTLIDRADTWSGNPRLRMTNQPHREYIYRMAFEMGRHIIGYEVQKVLAAVEWLSHLNFDVKRPIGIFGYGEGGLLALFAAALAPDVAATGVSGFFGLGDKMWEEPIYRNIWGYLQGLGYEVGEMIDPRGLMLEYCSGPKVDGPPATRNNRSGAAPGRLVTPSAEDYWKLCRTQMCRYFAAGDKAKADEVVSTQGPGSDAALRAWGKFLDLGDELKPAGKPPEDSRKDFSPESRLKRQFDQLVEHTQRIVRQSDTRRQEFFWSKLNLKSLDEYRKSCEPLRNYFWEEVIGKLPAPQLQTNPRTRLLHDQPKWKSYEVTLDLYPDVGAYGILTVPKDVKKGEKRPVVVCQHGLEGRPTDVVNPKEKTKFYNSFGSALADRGFVVFAPQNPYILQNKFRQLQRKANPLKLTLFSFIVRQHERILDWLATLPFVDEKRIGFYGLSYGGKTAMRVPAILERYCLSICSGDFNEWIWKITSVEFRASYMFTGEYEMLEFDLGNTFNYAEMAALIAPRPFMVERGHDDGVGIDEWVAYEYAKVRRHYDKLGIPERTTIEFFNGGHECHNEGTFAFLHKHLNWPAP